MLSRLLGGLVHPFIFVGYGVEFGLLGLVAEGLAQMAAHSSVTGNVITSKFFSDSSGSSVSNLATAFAEKVHLKSPAPTASVLAILGRMQKDPRLDIKKSDSERFFEDIIKDHGHIIEEYASLWEADTSTSQAVSKCVEEISWVVSIIYGVGGYRKGKPFTADFFAMHFVNASLFIPSFLVHLTAEAQRVLLRSFFATAISYWISQGRAQLNIEEFYANTSATPPIPGPNPTPHPDTLSKDNLSPNAWYPVLQSTLVHPNEHLLKLERALSHYAALYGTSPVGRFKAAEEELPGSRLLDGSIFLRTAWLSLERCGWVREGVDERVYWDFGGFYEDKPENNHYKNMY